MSPENARERREKRRYTFVVIPDAESQKTRNFSITRLGLIGIVAAAFIVELAFVVAVMIYTPVGSSLPISNAEVERRYGKDITGIQNQLNSLIQDMVVLRGYNIKLRRALGENISSVDSQFAAQQTTLSGSPRDVGDHERTDQSSSAVEPGNPMMQAQGKMAGFVQGTMAGKIQRAIEFPLTLPTDGYLTQGFEASQSHYGIDFAGRPGAIVMAAADGNVLFSGWTYDDGFALMVAHDEGYVTVYKHNQALLKITGQSVKRGEAIALLGNTGKTSSGPHLHFEVWKDGVAQDPQNYLLKFQ